MLKPDYNNNILNLVNSILKYYGADNKFPTLNNIDKLLEEDYQNVVLMLFDGLGEYNLEITKDSCKTLLDHKIGTIDSVFPPTTTAATTTLESGLPPATHNWLGWSLYFKQENSNVNIFVNTNDQGESPFDKNVVNFYLPYKNVIELINEKKQAIAESVSLFGSIKAKTLDDIINIVNTLCLDNKRRYIYTYYYEPDHTMHHQGVTSIKTVNKIKEINDKIEKLTTNLKDTLVIIVADHGHIDGIPIKLSDYPDFKDTLLRLPSIEPRANSLYIKEGRKKEFEELFDKYFSKYFILLTHKQVLDQELFGKELGETNLEDFIGDYLMIATSNRSLFSNDKQAESMIGVHAGMTNEEIKVPLIIFKCK
jgi:predicted AlkP superfamily pyrophosphatase or phosphodiesterase